MILQFCRCGGLFDAKGHPDGFLSHFSSLRNFRLGSFFDSLHPAGSPGGIFLFCRGAACRSRRYAAGPNRLSLKWKWPQICHCEGALRPWQSREGTGDSHRPPLKWYAPIASVAALSERHGQLQIWRYSRRMCNASKFVIARPQRGRGNLGKAVSFSPMAFLRSGYDLRDCTPRALPRASRSGRHVGLRPPRNDKLGGLAPLNCCCTTCNCLRRSGSATAAEPSKYPGMHPRKCGKAVAVGGFTKRSKKTSVWVLTKLRLGGIVSLALRGTEC